MLSWALPLILIAALLAAVSLSRYRIIVPNFLVGLFAPWAAVTSADWNGEGTLIGCCETGDPMTRHRGWTEGEQPPAGPFGTGRCVLVYLPPGYKSDRTDAYPILYALHGFGNRPDIWVETLLPLLEQEMIAGGFPDTVVVMPDFSISGNGMAKGDWPGEGRAGSWCIDSNLGLYESWFFDTLRPWIQDKFNVRGDAAATAVLGTSMGGFGALNYAVSNLDFAHSVAAVYPKADLRYSVSGSRLAPYHPGRYEAIEQDRPRRAMMGLDGTGLLGVAESFFVDQVFGTDPIGDENLVVWSPELPIWKRMESVNPLDILSQENVDLSGKAFYLSSGDRDEFNFHSHLPLIAPALEDSGAEVKSELFPGLRHGWWNDGPVPERLSVIRWLGQRLAEADQSA